MTVSTNMPNIKLNKTSCQTLPKLFSITTLTYAQMQLLRKLCAAKRGFKPAGIPWPRRRGRSHAAGRPGVCLIRAFAG